MLLVKGTFQVALQFRPLGNPVNPVDPVPTSIPTPVYHMFLELVGDYIHAPAKLQRSLIDVEMQKLTHSETVDSSGRVNAAFRGINVRENLCCDLLYPLSIKPSIRPYTGGKGVLFHGPPGTGKSVVSQYVCYNIGFRKIFWDVSSSLNDKYIGETVKNIEKLFDKAEMFPYIPCIIGLEEVDTIASKRSENSSSHDIDIISILLHRISTSKNVFLFCTTNRPSIY